MPVASTSQTQHQEVPIDPELISLPDDDDDDDLTNGPTVARALGYAPTKKVAGSRHKDKQPTIEGSIRGKGKGKERAGRADELTSRKRKQPADFDDDTRSTKRGRPQGAGNYSQEDLKALLDATQAELPLGQRGWQNIHAKFTKWARKHGRPDRALKSLETKFKQVCIVFLLQEPADIKYCSLLRRPSLPATVYARLMLNAHTKSKILSMNVQGRAISMTLTSTM